MNEFEHAPSHYPGPHVIYTALEQISGLVHAVHKGELVLADDRPHWPREVRYPNLALYHTRSVEQT